MTEIMLIMAIYGVFFGFMAYSVSLKVLKVPGKNQTALVKRIKDINLTEEQREKKYMTTHEKIIRAIADAITKKFNPNKLTKMELEDKLELANINMTAEDFISRQFSFALKFFLASIPFYFLIGELFLGLGVLLAVTGYKMPQRDLHKTINETKNRIVIELPDFLDMVIISLRAGRPLQNAIKKASEHSGSALKPLLNSLQADMELYDNKKDALWNFAEKTGIQEVRDFVSALDIGMSSGAKEAEKIYQKQAEIMRKLREMALKRKTKEAPQKLNYIRGWLVLNGVLTVLLPNVQKLADMFST